MHVIGALWRVTLSLTRVGLIVVALMLSVGSVYALFRAIDQRSAPPIVIEDAAATFPIVVEIRGAVESPGVYELPAGARVVDAVDQAGGFAANADLSTVNLARRLRDGEAIAFQEIPVVPVTTPDDSPRTTGAKDSEGESAGPINVNRATVDELIALPGIGEVTAQRIVDFREEHGPYRSIDDLVHVQGISTNTIENLRDLVTVAP